MGKLFVVGTGIRAGLQLTPEARQRIAAADEVFYLAADSFLTAGVIEKLNPRATSLAGHYGPTKKRETTYAEMVETILASVRLGNTVCAAFYGHPGVFVNPGHAAVRQARREGYPAVMLPGISAEDCLFADLGLDPGANGSQSYLGNDFVTRPRAFDVSTPLILWQITAIGDPANREVRDPRGVELLAEILEAHYGPDHEVVIYVAQTLPIGECTIERTTVSNLAATEIPEPTTLYVPALGVPEPDDVARNRLGLDTAAPPTQSARQTGAE